MTYARLKVKQDYRKKDFIEINFLVDSGAVYSLIPAKQLKKIGIKPHRKEEFTLADGTSIIRNIDDAYFEFQGKGGAAPVIFGEGNDEALLGALTLEALGLVLNPFSRELKPMKLMLAKTSRDKLIPENLNIRPPLNFPPRRISSKGG